MINGKKFQLCGTCGRWSTTHLTSSHVKRSDTNPGPSNLVPSFDHFAWCMPFTPAGRADFTKPDEPELFQRDMLLFYLPGLLFTPLINFGWLLSALLKGIWWVSRNWMLLLPPLIWTVLLFTGLAIPWLVPPEPEILETRHQRRQRV
jgi:hypothetical protein